LIPRMDSGNRINFPLADSASFDGIISYLTEKHSGNVHDTGIVTTTSKSIVRDILDCAARNIANVTHYSLFQSKN
jgi:hypothetical protein